MTSDAAPSGFARLDIPAGFAADFGAIYAKREGDRVWYGFRIAARHLNPIAHVHGGALATFADMQLAALMRTGRLEAKQSPTVSLSLDFLAPASVGDWVEGEIVLVKRTRRLAFTETILTVQGSPIARAKAMYVHSDSAAPLPAAAPTFEGVEAPAPEGFQPVDPGPGFGVLFGPMHWRPDPHRPALGFRVARRHINLFGACHGGALATLADYQLLPLKRSGLVDKTGFTPTLSLTIDYLGAARHGDWIGADATLARATGRYVFTQAMLSNAAGPVARSTAIYAVQRAGKA